MNIQIGKTYRLISEIYLKEVIVKVVNTKTAPSRFDISIKQRRTELREDKERKRFCYIYDPKVDRRRVQVVYREKDKLYLYDYEIKLETITNSRG